MDKEQKAQVVEEIASRLDESEAIFAIDYRGISVPQAAELRGALREADASFNIVKNRLAKRAAEQAGRDGLDEFLEGPTALTYVRGDVVTAAKAISNFNREHEVLTYKGGFMDGDALDEDRFKALARMPALNVMHGQLVGTIASPLTGLARGLGSMLSGLAVALGQIQEQGLVGGDAPAEEPKAEEAEEESAGSDPTPSEATEPAADTGSDPSESSESSAEEPEEEPAAEESAGSGPTESGESSAEESEDPPAEEPQAEPESEAPAEAEAAEGDDDAEASEKTEEENEEA